MKQECTWIEDDSFKGDYAMPQKMHITDFMVPTAANEQQYGDFHHNLEFTFPGSTKEEAHSEGFLLSLDSLLTKRTEPSSTDGITIFSAFSDSGSAGTCNHYGTVKLYIMSYDEETNTGGMFPPPQSLGGVYYFKREKTGTDPILGDQYTSFSTNDMKTKTKINDDAKESWLDDFDNHGAWIVLTIQKTYEWHGTPVECESMKPQLGMNSAMQAVYFVEHLNLDEDILKRKSDMKLNDQEALNGFLSQVINP